MAIEKAKTKDPLRAYSNTEGLNTQSTRYGRNTNQCVEFQDAIWTKSGGFKARNGQVHVNSNLPPANPGSLFGINFQRTLAGVTTQKKVNFCADGNVYDYTTDPPTLILAGLTPNAIPDVIVTEGWLCFVNGVDTPRKYNGTTWYQWGITAPIAAPTLAAGGAGSPNGTYRFRVGYRRNPLDALDPGAQSSMGTISLPITVVSQVINLTNIPVSLDPQVNARDLYVEISGLWYLFQTINDNVTTVASYDFLDSEVIQFEQGSLDRNPPEAVWSILEQHKGIVFASNTITLYWTPLDEFEAFSVNNRFDNSYDPSDGYNIIGLVSFTDLAVCKERSIFVRSGDDITWSNVKKVYDSGLVARNSVIVKDNILYYFAHDGFRTFDGNVSELICRNIYNLIFGNNQERIVYANSVSNITGVYYSDKAMDAFVWAIPTAANQYKKALLYYPGFVTTDTTGQNVGIWGTWKNLDAKFVFKAPNLTTKSDELFTFGTTGYLNRINTGYTDFGVDITAIYRQTDQFFGEQDTKKRLRDAYFSVSLDEGQPTTTAVVEWYVDGIATGITKTLDFCSPNAPIFPEEPPVPPPAPPIFDTTKFADEGDFVAVTGYGPDPFNTIAPRITWNVGEQSDDVTWNGWTLRVIKAGFRRKNC